MVLAFAARAATSPALATIQQTILSEIADALADAFTLAAAGRATAHCRLSAHVALAAADGLALHAVSSPGLIAVSQQSAALELLLDRLLSP
jgi:hypothetical protein